MTSRLGAALLSAPLLLAAALPAGATELPQIKVSPANPVPACATPGRLMALLKTRNPKLAAKFDGIATEYMRHGETLGLRWDIAFFQMIVETGALTFYGDVDIKQNNFAGLGATGKGESGESFKDPSTGVRAHLEHILMYSGARVDNPVAERTRKVQEWGVLTKWQSTLKEPMTYAQLAHQWAPKSRKYASDIESVADTFYDGPCKGQDPQPELVAAARAGRAPVVSADAAPVKSPPNTVVASTEDKTTGADLARRAVEEARAEGAPRTSLGAGALAKAAEKAAALEAAKTAPAPAVTVLNAPKTDPEQPAKAAEATPAASAPSKGATVQTASAAGAARALAPAASAKSKCNVYTASYGGQKAIIIKASAQDGVNYTVLDVNEGAEKREADAYIAAYAKGGETVGEFTSSDQALNKAFELCPEG